MGNQQGITAGSHSERAPPISPGALAPPVDHGAKEDIYVGSTLLDGRTPHGRGSLVYSSLDPERGKYEGEWENGQRHGKGRLIWKNGKIYEGDWRNDKLNGKGRLRWINGMEYEGEFESNAFSGTGMLRWPSGKAYYGRWAGGKQNGDGTLTYPLNDPKERVAYQGHFINDKRENMGRMVWRAKSGIGQAIYEGNWRRNKREGLGTYYFEPSSDSKQYHGEWRHGKRHGYGTILFRNGDNYAGFWFKDERHGRGVFTAAHGRVVHELYLNGTKQPLELHRQGTQRASLGFYTHLLTFLCPAFAVPQTLAVLCIEKLSQMGIGRRRPVNLPAELRERLTKCEHWHRKIASREAQLDTLHSWFGLLPPHPNS